MDNVCLAVVLHCQSQSFIGEWTYKAIRLRYSHHRHGLHLGVWQHFSRVQWISHNLLFCFFLIFLTFLKKLYLFTIFSWPQRLLSEIVCNWAKNWVVNSQSYCKYTKVSCYNMLWPFFSILGVEQKKICNSNDSMERTERWILQLTRKLEHFPTSYYSKCPIFCGQHSILWRHF